MGIKIKKTTCSGNGPQSIYKGLFTIEIISDECVNSTKCSS